jgi:hypothetical protein
VQHRLSSHVCPLLSPSVCRSAAPVQSFVSPFRACLDALLAALSFSCSLTRLTCTGTGTGTACKQEQPVGGFLHLGHHAGEAVPESGTGHLTSDSVTLVTASTSPRPSVQQVLAGLLSIDLTPECTVQGQQTTPTALTHAHTHAHAHTAAAPTLASFQGVSRTSVFSGQQQSATHGIESRGCVTGHRLQARQRDYLRRGLIRSAGKARRHDQHRRPATSSQSAHQL